MTDWFVAPSVGEPLMGLASHDGMSCSVFFEERSEVLALTGPLTDLWDGRFDVVRLGSAPGWRVATEVEVVLIRMEIDDDLLDFYDGEEGVSGT